MERADSILARLSRVRPLVAVEVGVWRGQLSEVLLRERPNLTLYMVDQWNSREQQPRSNRTQQSLYEEARRRVSFAHGRARILRTDSVSAAATFDDGSLDLVFIDADHRYPAVVADIEAWLPKVRPGGLLSGHDYEPRFEHERGYGVCTAVDEAAARYGWDLEADRGWTWFVRLGG